MKLIALESSGQVASVAILSDTVLLGEYSTNYKKTHSQTLLPMMDEVVKMTDTKMEEVDAIAVSAGPGSFTGLRIGSATAKGLGLALQKPIIAVPTLEALAYNLYGAEQLICPLMDARRLQVYTGIYEFVKETPSQFRLHKLLEGCAITIDQLIEQVNQIGKKIIFLGDGCDCYCDVIAGQCRVPYSYAPMSLRFQKAASVALLAQQMAEAGQYQTAAEHAPEYLRVSQAERELAEKGVQS